MPRPLYSPECVEVEFCELRLYGVLRSSHSYNSAKFAFWGFSEVRLSRIRDGRGVEASEIQVFDEDGLRPSRDGAILDNVGFVSFSDPDGNRWAVQQISFRG